MAEEVVAIEAKIGFAPKMEVMAIPKPFAFVHLPDLVDPPVVDAQES
jgi:hypothetical protein